MPLKACAYCGRIHPRGYVCPKKPAYTPKADTIENRFRHTNAWKEMSQRIRARDNYLCIYCLKHDRKITTSDIEVHHIVPLRADFNQRLDGDNLISLCRTHHEDAEAGNITRSALQALAREQEANPNARLPCR